jgi:hypothetical protein
MKFGNYGLLPVAFALTLAGCSGSGDADKKAVVDTNAIANSSKLTTAEKAAEMADAGEQLMSAQGFLYAEQIFDVALSYDSQNQKAGFYKRLLAFIMTDQGIIKRLEKVSSRTESSRISYQKMIWGFSKTPESNLTKFLLKDGGAAIETESDIQGYFESKVLALENLRQWLRQNKQASFKLNGTDSMLEGLGKRMVEECATVENEQGIYEINCKNWEERMRNSTSILVNGADLEAIQHMVAGLEVLFTMYVSYDFSGAMDAAMQPGFATMGSSDQLNVLLKNPSFGTLRKDSQLSKISEMGADAIAGARWLKANQAAVCKNPIKKFNRPGFLFNQGFCMQEKPDQAPFEEIAQAASNLFRGGKISKTFELKTGYYQTDYAPLAALVNPIKDIRQLGLRENGCGQLIPQGDPTIAGMFPAGDGLKVLEGLSQCRN